MVSRWAAVSFDSCGERPVPAEFLSLAHGPGGDHVHLSSEPIQS